MNRKRADYMSCPFCRLKEKFNNIYLEGVEIPEEQQFGAWIDYEEDKHDNVLWYAILNGDQFVSGYTLVISGMHIVKMTGNANEESLKSIILGLNRVSKNLKEKLNCEAIHVLTLCEGQEHLHFHLIPRFKNEKNSKANANTPDHEYSNDERNYFVKNYWQRDKELFDVKSGEKKYKTEEDFVEAIDKKKKDIHGMWYAGYHERNYKFIDPNNPKEIEKRINDLKDLTGLLRNPDLAKPRFLRK